MASPNYVMSVAENLREAVHRVCVSSQARAKDETYQTIKDMADALNLANQLINDLERVAKQ